MDGWTDGRINEYEAEADRRSGTSSEGLGGGSMDEDE